MYVTIRARVGRRRARIAHYAKQAGEKATRKYIEALSPARARTHKIANANSDLLQVRFKFRHFPRPRREQQSLRFADQKDAALVGGFPKFGRLFLLGMGMDNAQEPKDPLRTASDPNITRG